jgi:DNA replication protein DnaC
VNTAAPMLFDDLFNRTTNLVVLGSSSVGKPYLAKALVHAACRIDYTARYYRLDDLEGRGSTAVTSQFDPEDWYKSLHDAVIAESILNRIISNAEIVQLAGPNMRRHTAAENAEEAHAG